MCPQDLHGVPVSFCRLTGSPWPAITCVPDTFPPPPSSSTHRLCAEMRHAVDLPRALTHLLSWVTLLSGAHVTYHSKNLLSAVQEPLL